MRRKFVPVGIAIAVAVGVSLFGSPATQATPAKQAAPSASVAAAAPVQTVQLPTAKAALDAVAAYTEARCGNSSGYVVPSIDDWGYADPYVATRVGQYLKNRHIRGMFFLINQNAKNYPGIVSTLRAQGHWVLNHTYSHPNLTTLSNANVSWQIRNGIPRTNLLRPPGGASNSRVSGIAASLGFRICKWTVDTRDWERPDGVHYRSIASIRSIAKAAPASAKTNGMILGHLFSQYPSAIGGIIDDYIAQGYKFCRNTGPMGYWAHYPLNC